MEKTEEKDNAALPSVPTSKDIKVLEGLEGVRRRPAMYIGDTSSGGLHHLVYEVVDNSIDEALAGYCTEIEIVVYADGSVSVKDNGRGIPVDIHETEKRSALEVVMTKLHAGGKFDHKLYKVSGGLHGVGVSVVNALSEWLEVEVYMNGKVYFQEYEHGRPVAPVQQRGKTNKRGTKVIFKASAEVFKDSEINFDAISKRMHELAFLNSNVTITIMEEATDRKEQYNYKDGVKSFIKYLNENKTAIHSGVIYFQRTESDVEVEVGMQYNDGYSETLLSFVNTINTLEGGTHVSGFRAALTKTFNKYMKKEKLVKDNEKPPQGDDFREGLTTVLSVRIPEPQFESQTKIKLGNREVQGVVESIVSEELGNFLEENPSIARSISKKAIISMRARDAARKAKELVHRKDVLASGALPGKLADCSSRDAMSTELFLVEGDSAGGTAKMGRDRRFQAILALRGKILNVEKARLEKVLGHEEIRTIVQALGTGIGSEDFDITKTRYGKIVLMTDADVDGSHIRTLLLTFFYRQMRELIEAGYLYIAQPPLFRVKHGKRERYVHSEKEMKEELLQLGADNTKVVITKKKITLEGAALKEILRIVSELEQVSRLVARKGITFEDYINSKNNKQGGLPKFRVILDNEQTLLYSDKEYAKFMKDSGIEENENTEAEDKLVTHEFHERDRIEKLFKELEKFGMDESFYFEQKDAPETPKLQVVNDKEEAATCSLREVLEKVREAGSKGLDIQRYKGLGEMNANQLWETTLDPARRTLLNVSLENAAAAEEMFSTLMGPGVEPRR
ncbi:MAG: DNA topoisomerase (ATP-hydrolyzing) subunit B, partial [Planctomycetota bacterium]